MNSDENPNPELDPIAGADEAAQQGAPEVEQTEEEAIAALHELVERDFDEGHADAASS